MIGSRPTRIRLFLACAFLVPLTLGGRAQQDHRFLYVAVPGIEDDTSHRGISIFVFDIDHEHKFVKRIPVWAAGDEAETVRGIAASGPRLYISTTSRLGAIDLTTEKIVWENNYGGHCCDRLAVSPDGRTIYAPAFGNPLWRIVDAATGAAQSTISVVGSPRNTIFAHDGSVAFLSAWESNVLTIADTKTRAVTKEIGPFSGFLCPFTINGKESLAFANVDGLVGFEVGDLQTGLVLDRVEAEDYTPEQTAAYECPSHGIAFAPGERELWVADGVGSRLHIFDATMYPPVVKAAIDLTRQPRWIVFGIDGRYAYSSTGDVIDAASKKISATLREVDGRVVESEKMIEVDFAAGKPARAGQQISTGFAR